MLKLTLDVFHVSYCIEFSFILFDSKFAFIKNMNIVKMDYSYRIILSNINTGPTETSN